MKEGLPEDVTKDQVLHEVEGLRSSCILLRQLESRDYPLEYYSSGEVEFKRNDKGQLLVDKDHHPIEVPVALPVYGKLPSDNACLLHGVKRSIGSRLQMLSEWGGHDEAMDMIREYQLIPKKGTIYERKS